MKVSALFKKAAAPAKAAPAKTEKAKPAIQKKAAPAPAKKSGKSASSKGAFGGEAVLGLDRWYGPDRKLFLPGGLFDRSDVPAYLNGTYAGDYGYDPLGLGKEGGVEKYRAYELIHARWAMLGAAGAIIPEGLAANGADVKGATWFETGKVMLDGDTLNYFAVPWVNVHNPLPLVVVAAIQVALMGAVETFRANGTGPGGYSPGGGKFDSSVFEGLDSLHPGGPFDPLGLADDPDVFAELKVKEIKNGRLAMVSFLGFAVQAAVTGEGPYANWSKHVADPFGYNLLTILAGEDRTPTL